MSNPRLGIAVIGFGWMGQAHSRSYARIPSLFPDRTFEPELVVCADNMPERGEEALVGNHLLAEHLQRLRRAPRARGDQALVARAHHVLGKPRCSGTHVEPICGKANFETSFSLYGCVYAQGLKPGGFKRYGSQLDSTAVQPYHASRATLACFLPFA